MQTYIGTKIIKARQMRRDTYNDYRGWELPADEDGSDDGYLVEYIDASEQNNPDHVGYISWSPCEVFDNAYKNVKIGMTFGGAVEMMKNGCKVARTGWNGKGMWLILVPGSPSIKPVAGTPYSNAGITEPTNICPHFDMYTAAGEMQPGWHPSTPDTLADDWIVID